MTRLTKLVIPALAASLALGVAAPASAAPWNAQNFKQEIAKLDRQVEQAERRNLITRSEARQLDRLVGQLERLHRNYARDGFTKGEARILQNQINKVEKQIASEIDTRNKRHDSRNDNRRGDYRR